MNVWQEPLVKLRVPKIFHLRRDPFERADFNSTVYWDWMVDHVFMLYEMQALVAAQIEDFVKFPPRQKPASFNLDAVLAQVVTATGAARANGKAGERPGKGAALSHSESGEADEHPGQAKSPPGASAAETQRERH